MVENIINGRNIIKILEETGSPSKEAVRDILSKAKLKAGLTPEEAGILVNLSEPELIRELLDTAGWVKNQIYGERLVFFAPLYVSDFCINDCDYCNFHSRNMAFKRKRLNLAEVEEQTKVLINMGHKRVLVEFGEDPLNNNIDYVTKVIDKIYSVKTDKGSIRRINVNIAATTVENYRKLKKAKIGTYQLFQETYHRNTYEKIHHGPKADYLRQISAYERAFEAGLDDLGLGVLFGLYDWRFETLALITHAWYLDKKYKIGPHTISVPRVREAATVNLKLPHKISDEDFLKLIAILRLAVPYTGMIISTRESPEIRSQAFKIGISQASAGSCTAVGGYGKKTDQSQFKVQDERCLEEVISDAVKNEFLPSFCTACYRLGRTGEEFMGFSKPGEIHNFCRPNGILTFAEYLEDFAKNETYEKGQEIIQAYLDKIEDKSLRQKTRLSLEEIKQGKRDLYF
ncbi:MAG: [FeFe] hydrogenase H-cluster radical SAM maturase HydG [Candidatus Omnitrophota bacterium]|nr:[FeFe] hydrogenase H-cluster radical SAM maturase HydG [Candidatus Omnitrophota bacterium]MBU1929279.1 [FeFe] hydrogenase H-cluster radical SAM maturase HydG [Candidatus Omnitrophota bacterium]MBU2035571.1 [FeFe] hydrogenase H-cluster radical SAM maturase HydG [Candidatus Omnitrophota bacterium]MBU2221479.1 [FeFe] hydrogenase H-cluster radical SAM maturase HydG [Candidatus Omnitrophota bacterium]MBU2257816.1 [FeFe] hydrogenase H-cluster radical SAM maturase HydG [Candidatus Omnitrophota bact